MGMTGNIAKHNDAKGKAPYERGWRDAAATIYWASSQWNEGHDTFLNGYIYTKTLESVNSFVFFAWSDSQLSQRLATTQKPAKRYSKNAKGADHEN